MTNKEYILYKKTREVHMVCTVRQKIFAWAAGIVLCKGLSPGDRDCSTVSLHEYSLGIFRYNKASKITTNTLSYVISTIFINLGVDLFR